MQEFASMPRNEIGTERLLLRPPGLTDADNIFARYGQDPEVCRFMLWKPHRTVDDTLEFLRRIVSDNAEGRSMGYLIFLRSSGKLLGSVGGGIEGCRMQFGYCLARDAWGHGYATEAARAFVSAAFELSTLWRVQAYCDLENSASARVLEKIGLEREGILRRHMKMPNLGDERRDLYCYAKVRQPAPRLPERDQVHRGRRGAGQRDLPFWPLPSSVTARLGAS
jgi:RimJ/RimL family protein N-acetyltransferase